MRAAAAAALLSLSFGCASVGVGPNGEPTCWAGPGGHATYTMPIGTECSGIGAALTDIVHDRPQQLVECEVSNPIPDIVTAGFSGIGSLIGAAFKALVFW